MKMKRIAVVLLVSLLVFMQSIGLTAFADTPLPDGAVKGLPERLAALDDEGNPVNSETGEYFFHVEGMDFGETYTKNIQLINLREDYTYHIWFYVEPLFKAGEIDLEKGCECRFLRDGEEFYCGSVYGDGNIDLKTEHFDCGSFAPGESHSLRCEVVWNNLDVVKSVDNGKKLVDVNGKHVLVGADSDGHTEGEIEFKWIFYAKVEPHDMTPDEPRSGDYAPQTGLLLKNGAVWLIGIGVIAVLIVVLLVLIKRNKKKDKEQSK